MVHKILNDLFIALHLLQSSNPTQEHIMSLFGSLASFTPSYGFSGSLSNSQLLLKNQSNGSRLQPPSGSSFSAVALGTTDPPSPDPVP